MSSSGGRLAWVVFFRREDGLSPPLREGGWPILREGVYLETLLKTLGKTGKLSNAPRKVKVY